MPVCGVMHMQSAESKNSNGDIIDAMWFMLQMLEAVLNVCNSGARIPCCGMISQYNVQDKEGIRNLFMVNSPIDACPKLLLFSPAANKHSTVMDCTSACTC